MKFVARERHVLFVNDVKTVRENVNLKNEELREEMAKKIVALNHNYSSLHTKIDIIVFAVTKFVEWYNSLLPKVDKMATDEIISFGNIEKVLV